MPLKEIGKRVKERRKELGFSQAKLYRMSRISAGTMYRLEKGEAQLTFLILNKILNVLGMELAIRDKK